VRLTDAIVKRLPLPTTGARISYDSVMPGFGARVTANGARSFVLNYRVKTGRERRYTIGSATHWRVTEARSEARRLKRIVDQGGDPLGEIQAERDAPTVDELCKRFAVEHIPRLRESTRADYGRLIKHHVLPILGKDTKVANVSFSDIDRLHRKLTDSAGPYSANRVVAMCSKMFNLAVRWEMRESNPARGIERNYEAKRRRYLSAEELPRLVAALDAHGDQQAADIVRLLLFTGARKGEVLAARWADIDLGSGIWSKPAHTTKQGTDHIAPLSAPARALLARVRDEQAKLFPHRLPTHTFSGRYGHGHRQSIKRAWEALMRSANIGGFRIHDLRHTYASLAVAGGASLVVTGALLGHVVPATTQRYAHLADDPLRQVTERIGALIEAAGKPVAAPIKFRK
jgi:integrase